MEPKPFSLLKTRRDFIRQAACAAVGTVALSSTIRDLRLINAVMAQTPVNDYKALVCIFLSGGNDSNNLIIPLDSTDYANYSILRTPVLAIPSGSALPLPVNPDGRHFGLHPSCTDLATLYGDGTPATEKKLAILFNTGTLVGPLTRAQYYSSAYKKPPQLFSHSDQVTQWQTSIPDRPAVTGWGGRCADLLASVQPDAKVSFCISVTGANIFETGSTASQYSVSSASGAIALTGLSTNSAARLTAATNIMGLTYPNLQQQAYSKVAAHAIGTADLVNAAIARTSPLPPANWVWNPTTNAPFPNTTLGNQLKMVARLIDARAALNMKRQIFFCSVGGYDTHTGQTTFNSTTGQYTTTTGQQANLLSEVSKSMLALQRAMEQLGIPNSVTAFTASDFSRTFPANGQGTDHGWGSHHLITGGAVNGGHTYGRFPVQTIKGPDDTDTGRWIPSTSVDQYFATLASWFGVTNTDLYTVFPNLGRFAAPNLGFI